MTRAASPAACVKFARVQCFIVAALLAIVLVVLAHPGTASAQQTNATGAQSATAPTATVATGASTSPTTTAANADGSKTLTVDLSTGKSTGTGSGPLQIILVVTIIALAPAILMLVTAFTRIVIVLGLTRNALNLQGVPPNQVLIGIALFFTIFVMAPVIDKANTDGLQPYLDNKITQQEALTRASAPFKTFMLDHVREPDLALFIDLSGKPAPANPEDVPFTTLIPAFVIGELRAAFLIGFVIYIPFLIIDIVTSGTLMSMGMVMVQPATVALPFKLLLFVLVDGWSLLAGSLIRSFGG
jgi:flagellar biosynthetic protein FliP